MRDFFMQDYEQIAFDELKRWQKEMMQRPSLLNQLSKRVQTKLNSYIPEKIHKAITTAIKQMVRGVLFGAQYTTKNLHPFIHFNKQKKQSKSWLKPINTLLLLKVVLPAQVEFY